MSQSHGQEYEYKPRWSAILLAMLFFGACAACGVVKAHWNNRGLIIEGIIRLSPQGATVFWWIYTALSMGIVLFCVFLGIRRLIQTQRIVLTPNAIIVPKSRWSSDEITILYAKITDVWETKKYNQKFLHISYQEGKSTIVASCLPTERHYYDIRCFLVKRVEAVKTLN